MERDTRFELAPPAWKAGMLTINTNPALKVPVATPALSGRKEMITPREGVFCDYSQWCGWPDSNRHGLAPNRFSSLLYVTIAIFLCCSPDYVFSISHDLGGWYIVSTHLWILKNLQHYQAVLVHALGFTWIVWHIIFNLARRYLSKIFTELASIHSRSFLSWCSCSLANKSLWCLPIPPHPHI